MEYLNQHISHNQDKKKAELMLFTKSITLHHKDYVIKELKERKILTDLKRQKERIQIRIKYQNAEAF